MQLRLRRVVPPLLLILLAQSLTAGSEIQQWDIFEISLNAQPKENPFDQKVSATFTSGDSNLEARGFYDGDGVYRIRFMPPAQGEWKYQTTSDLPELSGNSGQFTCVKPADSNHGPVVAHNQYHFAYADGTPFIPVSTTIYGWAHQRSDELKEQTLATLKASPFNRVRMMMLPISYGRDNEPNFLPFERDAEQNWNYSKIDPRFFQDMEKRVGQLRDMGIEAELILFHNRDGGRTRLDRMPADADDRYVRYVVARFSAFRNVWWSLANEFDSLRFKKDSDWDRIFQIIEAEDPSKHLRSIHQMRRYYDLNKPWVTHLSVQSELAVTGFGRPAIYRQLFGKPVVFDEPKYEGDIPDSWGRLSGEEMTFRFWICAIAGTYATHGETFASAPGVRWISRGGRLVGESPARIAFLREILASAPPGGLTPIEPDDATKGVASRGSDFFLVYFGKSTPTEWRLAIPGRGMRGGGNLRVEVIDTWNMTITPIDPPATMPATNPTPRTIPLPGRPYMAVRIQRQR